MGKVDIKEVGPDLLELYQSIPMSFRVESIYVVDVRDGGLGGLVLVEEPATPPYTKDYDREHGQGVSSWKTRFDISHWLFLLAFDGQTPIGGAAVAFDTPGLDMLAGRKDLAVLWDIRVHPEHRGRGIGRALFDRAAAWARNRGCRQLKVETQNINVPACRFYASMGCRLGAIDRYAYRSSPSVSHEVMLMWYLDLQG